MPSKLTKEELQRTMDAINKAIRAGYRIGGQPSAIQAASEALKLHPHTTHHRYRVAMAQGYQREDMRPLDPVPEIRPLERPRVIVRAGASDAPLYRVLAIGDAHDSPALPDKSRFRWIARHAAKNRPDYVVQIGDFADFDSLSRHDAPGSLPQKTRPSYNVEMASLEEVLAIFYTEANGIKFHVTLGNHEARILRYERSVAEIEGALWQPLMDMFARYNWRTHQEGEFLFIGAVGFVHAPRTLMNREYGGKTMNAIANDSVMSTVFGHSHRGQVLHAPKIGPGGGITLVNLGTCLPTGYIKEYAKVAMSSWTYGVYDLVIQGGRIISHSFHSMDELEQTYGD